MTRKLSFEGLQNFRDFGGYAAAGGARLATGTFWRSAHHARATDADVARLKDMNIATVVDLRRPSERARDPSRRWETFSAAVVENHVEEEHGIEVWDDFVAASDMSAQSFRDYLNRFYRVGPHAPRHVDLFRRYFDALADGDGALLVHCTGGKDRTGMAVALTHTLAGVHEDDVFADFLATNDPERFAVAAPMWAKGFARTYGREPGVDAMLVAMGVEADYLHGAFAAMRERHGSVANYLRDGLGIDDAKRARILKRLLAS